MDMANLNGNDIYALGADDELDSDDTDEAPMFDEEEELGDDDSEKEDRGEDGV